MGAQCCSATNGFCNQKEGQPEDQKSVNNEIIPYVYDDKDTNTQKQIQTQNKVKRKNDEDVQSKNCSQGLQDIDQKQPIITSSQYQQPIQKENNIVKFEGPSDNFDKCKIDGHQNSKICKICIHKNCWQSQRFMCIECQAKQLHQGDMDFTNEKLIEFGQLNKIIVENQEQIKSLNCMFHEELIQITNLFRNIYKEVGQAYKDLLKLFSVKDKCYENNFSDLLNDKNALIEFVKDQQLIKLLTDAPLDIFLQKHQSVLQCFKKISSNIKEFYQISCRTKKLEEEFQKLLERGQKFEKQEEDPNQSISKSLIKQTEYSQELESQILYSQNIDFKEGTQQINCGYIKYKLKFYEDSLKLYYQALDNSNQNEQYIIYYYIGKCLLKQFQLKNKHINDEKQISKEKEIIMEKFDQTKKQCPSFKKVYQQIYKLHSLLGDQEQATLFMVKEKQINNDYKLFLKLGNIYKYLNQNETAIIYYDKCIEKQSNNLEALYNKGDILFMIGNYGGCIKIMEQIIKVNKEYSDAYLLLSDSLLKLDNWKDALGILVKRKKSFKLDQRFLDKLEFIYDLKFPREN